jgi:hypothetical protein
MSDAFEGYLERGSIDHLGGGNKKSHPCAMAIPLWQSVNSERENEQVSEQHIRPGEEPGTFSACQPFPQGGWRESKAEVVSVTDSYAKSAFSEG